MSRSTYIILTLLLAAGIHCKKNVPAPNILPPLTQEGKNSFGCKVNGKVWTPNSNCNIFYGRKCKELGFEVRRSDSTQKLPISFDLGTERDIDSSSFEIYAPSFNIKQTGNIIDSIILMFYKTPDQFFHFPPGYIAGEFNVTTLDTVNNIMAGTFFFTLHDSGRDSVVVTDGRFDFTFNACLCSF